MTENIFGDKQIKVVRQVGDKNSAYLEDDGTTVYRSQEVFIKDIGLVKCAPYDNEFTFRHVYKKKGIVQRQWTLFCTCGGPAVVVGYSGYAKDASPGGELLVCYHHATNNVHLDGSS